MAKQPEKVDWVALFDSVCSDDTAKPSVSTQNSDSKQAVKLAGPHAPPPAAGARGDQEERLPAGEHTVTPLARPPRRSRVDTTPEKTSLETPVPSPTSVQLASPEPPPSEDPLAALTSDQATTTSTTAVVVLPQTPPSLLASPSRSQSCHSTPISMASVCGSQPSTPLLLRTPALTLVPVRKPESSGRRKSMDILSYLDKTADPDLKDSSKPTGDVAMETRTPFSEPASKATQQRCLLLPTSTERNSRKRVHADQGAAAAATPASCQPAKRRRGAAVGGGGGRRRGKKEKMEQWHLDFGQRDFGSVTCLVCGMVYTKGQPEDGHHHRTFHRSFLRGVSFPGWKRERVVAEFSDGRVLVVLPSDPRNHLKKVAAICELVDSDLGYAKGVGLKGDSYKVYLYVSTSKKLMGCIVAEPISKGYPVITAEHAAASSTASSESPDGSCSGDDPTTPAPATSSRSPSFDSLSAWFCSPTPQPAELGVNRMWVAAYCRRRGVATRLLDVVRSSFTPGGRVVPPSLLAFSDPTPDGKVLASKYCQTESFLVYRWT